ncbi:MAG: hypothetical protein LBE09_02655, partial [Christensenellaceae bacterium]|nr:hypothetical protein [Christensenellaceae bacterium]
MKNIITIVVLIAIALSICHPTFISATMNNSTATIRELSSVAQIEDDTYLPYAENPDDYILTRLNRFAMQFGGYTTAIGQNTTNNENILLNDSIIAESVIQVIEVYDTKNNLPIRNALVRLNGVPFWTDYYGKVVCEISQAIVELYIEKRPYNTHIEFIKTSNSVKRVLLKMPSDDIEVNAVILEYEAQYFNLLVQPCILNRDVSDSYCEIRIGANVAIDRYILYINGQIVKSLAGNVIEDFKFDQYVTGDKFEVQIYYNGIASEKYSLKIQIADIKPNLSITADSIDNSSYSENIAADSPFGMLGTLEINPAKHIEDHVLELIWGDLNQIEYHGDVCKINFLYDPYTGMTTYTVGVETEPIINQTAINISKKKIAELEATLTVLDYNASESEKLIIEAENDKTNYLLEHQMQYWVIDDYIKTKNQQIYDLQQKYDFVHQSGKRREIKDSIKQEKRNIQNIIMDWKIRYQNYLNEVNRIMLQRGGSNEYGLRSQIYQITQFDGVTRNVQTIENVFIGIPWFNFSIEFEVVGIVSYNVVKNEFVELIFSAGANFTITHELIKTIIPDIIIDFAFDLSFTLGLKVTLHVINLDKEWVKFDDVLDYLEYEILASVKLEVGLKSICFFPGVYAYGYVKANLKMKFEPYRTENSYKFTGAFNWEFALKYNIMFCAVDITFESKPVELWETKIETASNSSNEMTRAFNTQATTLSGDQLYSGIYQASSTQLVQLGDKYLLIWVADLVTRDDYNRTALCYAVYDAGVWSEPQYVLNDGKCDLYPSIYVESGTTYLVWQKAGRIFNENDDPASMLKACDIYFAEFDDDNNIFTGIERITDTLNLDVVPSFALKENESDELRIVWIRNCENDILGVDGKNAILTSVRKNGTWSNEEVLFETEDVITSISSTIDN